MVKPKSSARPPRCPNCQMLWQAYDEARERHLKSVGEQKKTAMTVMEKARREYLDHRRLMHGR